MIQGGGSSALLFYFIISGRVSSHPSVCSTLERTIIREHDDGLRLHIHCSKRDYSHSSITAAIILKRYTRYVGGVDRLISSAAPPLTLVCN